MSSLLEVKNLVKYFPVYSKRIIGRKVVANVHAVDNINFTINKGETMGLVGESGCGKTTTGKLILYLEKPTSGEIIFEKNDVISILENGLKEEKLKLRQLAWDQPKVSEAPVVFIVLADRDAWKAGHPFVEKNFEEMVRAGSTGILNLLNL